MAFMALLSWRVRSDLEITPWRVGSGNSPWIHGSPAGERNHPRNHQRAILGVSLGNGGVRRSLGLDVSPTAKDCEVNLQGKSPVDHSADLVMALFTSCYIHA